MLWTGARNSNGYGNVKVRGKTRKAHREAYEAINGEGSAAGFVIRHRCDTPACVNPDHLEIGTHADNVHDCVNRGRHRHGDRQGSANFNAKLTDVDVSYIRSVYVLGHPELGRTALARKFGVSPSAIGRIISRKQWWHVS